MKFIKKIVSITALAALCACTGANQSSQKEVAPIMPERYAMPAATKKVEPRREGAIFSVDSKSIYQDSRAKRVGDVVLINIVETSSGTKKAETKTSRDSNLTGGIASLFGYESLFAGKDHTPSKTSIDVGFGKDFSGSGETSRNSSVTATISARVIGLTMDGNLIVRGFREVRVNDETQHIIVSGIVRPEDISKDNSIQSSHIAEARIEYAGSGTLASKQQPGWLANTMDVIWPF